MSAGKASFTMEFDKYSECPSNISEKVMAKEKRSFFLTTRTLRNYIFDKKGVETPLFFCLMMMRYA